MGRAAVFPAVAGLDSFARREKVGATGVPSSPTSRNSSSTPTFRRSSRTRILSHAQPRCASREPRDRQTAQWTHEQGPVMVWMYKCDGAFSGCNGSGKKWFKVRISHPALPA